MRLIDCFTDIFAYTSYFLELAEVAVPAEAEAQIAAPVGAAAEESGAASGPTPVETMGSGLPAALPHERHVSAHMAAGRRSFSFNEVRDNYHRLMAQSETLCQKGRFRKEDFHLARFAVSAWVDEQISCSNWKEKMGWPKEELQRVYYQTTNAGEEFFQYLRGIPEHQKGVLEVYATCLSLGYQGRYYGKYGKDELEALRLTMARRFLGSLPDNVDLGTRELFPNAYPKTSAVAQRSSGVGEALLIGLVIAVPIFIGAGLYCWWSLSLDTLLDDFFKGAIR